MAIIFEKKPIEWKNEGVEPPAELTEGGFVEGYKPPADYFNSIFNTTTACIKELQNKVNVVQANVENVKELIPEIPEIPEVPTDEEIKGIANTTITERIAPTAGFEDNTSGTQLVTPALLKGYVPEYVQGVVENLDLVGDFLKTKTLSVASGNGSGIVIGRDDFEPDPTNPIVNDSIVLGNGSTATGGADTGKNSISMAGASVTGNGSIGSGIGYTKTSYSLNLGENYNNVGGNYSVIVGTDNEIGDKHAGVESSGWNTPYNFVIGEGNITRWTMGKPNAGCTMICGTSNLIDCYNQGGGNTYNFLLGDNNKTYQTGNVIIGNDNTIAKRDDTGGRADYNFVTGVANYLYSGGMYNFVAGYGHVLKDCYNSSAFGINNYSASYNFVCGKYAKTPTATDRGVTTGDLFTIGNGIYSSENGTTSRSNAFRVTAAGEVMGTQAYSATGADYAEMFEWLDGNPKNADRRGLFVTLDGEKLKLATSKDDYIVGVVSATPSVVGDACTDDWNGKWKTDIFGKRIVENGAWVLNEGFDESKDNDYVSRADRKEWVAVGMVGKLVVVDDGTCEVNGYCYPSKRGIATKSDSGYRVIARLDEKHIKVVLK